MANLRGEDEVLAGWQRPGWIVTGREAEKKPVANPNRLTTSDPATIEVPTGNIKWTIMSADGTQTDEVVVSMTARFNPEDPTTDKPVPVKGPTKNLTGTAAQPKPTPTGQLDKIDAQGNLIPAGSTTRPAKLRDPATGTTIDLPDPSAQPEGKVQEFGNQLLLIKPDGSYTVIASKTTTTTPQATTTFDGPDGGRYEYDPNKPAGQRVTQVLAAPVDKTAPTTKTINGKTFQWNPATRHWDESGLPAAETTTAAGEIVWQDIPDTDEQQAVRIVNGQRVLIEGLTRKKTEATTLIGGADSQVWTFVDKQGNVVRTVQNPNYKPPPGTALTPDLISNSIPVLKPDGTIDWQPNQNRVAAGQAMQDLLAQVGIQVDGGQMSMAQAKDLLSGAVNTMTARTQQQQQQAQVATGTLTALGQAAQTGAGLLQQRVSSAQNMLNSVLGLAGQGQPSAGRYGTLGGGLMSAPAGLGANLVGGIGGWTAQLMGGQPTLDTAARLVRAVDPSNGESPMAQAAYGVLTQMLDRYGQETGQPHPLVAATQAAAQTQGTGGMVAPVTAQPTTQPTILGFRAPSMVDLGLTAAPARGPLMG